MAIDAGVDFPRLLLEAAQGRAPAVVQGYQVGLRSRWWWGEVDHLLARLRRSNTRLALPPDAPSRARAAWEFVRWRVEDRSDVWRTDDPRPFLRESWNWLLRR